ncbi:MAG: glucose-1-phosphate adenylyltransferase subunit GlgD [Oscillospiraceae bacterium]
MTNHKTLGLIFANMHDSSVPELTAERSMASMPFAGRYRLIDFYLSSLVDADATKVGVVTKSNYHSLMDHLGSGRSWDLSRKRDGISILPPYSYSPNSKSVYHGRIEALYNILEYIRNSPVQYVAMMDCDYVCSLDLDDVIDRHVESEADVTMVCCDMSATEEISKNCVTIQRDADGRITDLMQNRYEKGGLLSMNVIVIGRDLLIDLIENAQSRMQVFFERDVLLSNILTLNIRCYEHQGYVRRIYNLNSYYEASMSLLEKENLAALFGKRTIYTKVRDEAPVRYGLNSNVKNSLVADGCVVEGVVENSILFRGTHVAPGAVVRNSIVMQGSFIKTGASLDCVITDKNVTVGEGRKLTGTESYPMYIKKKSTV